MTLQMASATRSECHPGRCVPGAPALVKLGEHYKLWKGEAEPQLTLVDLAKGLRERHEKWNIDNPDD